MKTQSPGVNPRNGSNKKREANDDININSAINIDDEDDDNEGKATQNLKISMMKSGSKKREIDKTGVVAINGDD